MTDTAGQSVITNRSDWSLQITYWQRRLAIRDPRYAIGTSSPHVRESKTVLDSGFHAMDSGFADHRSEQLTPSLCFTFC